VPASDVLGQSAGTRERAPPAASVRVVLDGEDASS
jgi:hypothetical protein